MAVVLQLRDYQPRPKPLPYPPLAEPASIVILPVVRIERDPDRRRQNRKRKDV